MERTGRIGPLRRDAAGPRSGLRWLPYLGAGALSAALLVGPRAALAAGSVDAVAQDAAQGLGPTPTAVLVVAAPLVSDQATPRGDELSLRIAALVAGRLGSGARAHAQTAGLAAARALAGRASALVFVQSEIHQGDLRTTLDVYPSSANAWDRIRNPLPSPSGHAFATAKLDAEVRSFLAPLSLEQASVRKFRHDEGDVLSAACGDVEGDGGQSLVLVTRARVAVGRLREGHFVAERTAAWSALARRAPVPLREPLASAVVTPGAIALGTTDRGGLTVTPDLAGHTVLSGIPAWSSEGLVCLRPDASVGAFDGAPVDCASLRDDKPRLAVPAPRFDAFASARFVDAAGATRTAVAVREPSGRLRLRAGETLISPEGDFGAQLALADLDEDGQPDLVTTSATTDDAVNVFSVSSDAAELRGRLHLGAPGRVHALAVCPPAGSGGPALVAVLGSEVWLVRASVAGAPRPRTGAR